MLNDITLLLTRPCKALLNEIDIATIFQYEQTSVKELPTFHGLPVFENLKKFNVTLIFP